MLMCVADILMIGGHNTWGSAQGRLCCAERGEKERGEKERVRRRGVRRRGVRRRG